jgi:hypothetical protein
MSDQFPHDTEPDGDVSLPHHFWIGIALSVFSFWSVWPAYPAVGAVGTLLGLLVALDDAVEHAFGIPTPLDQLWNRWLRDMVIGLDERLRRGE